MRKLIFAAFLATSVMMSSSAMATEVHVSSTNPVIDLTISETVETPPDIATFSTGVQTMAPTASAAVRANNVQMASVVARMVSNLDPLKTWAVEVTEWRRPRTNKQNAFIFGVCYPAILESGGELLGGWTR